MSEAEPRILAWHFCEDPPRLRYGGREPVEAGRTYSMAWPYTYEGRTYDRPTPCKAGLHASERAIDALEYAPGPVVCRVEVWGRVAYRGEPVDKLCGDHRRVLWLADAMAALDLFACDVAEWALLRERAAGREPDPRCWRAVEVKRAWVAGEASDEDLAAAGAAAWDAARDEFNGMLAARLEALSPAVTGA